MAASEATDAATGCAGVEMGGGWIVIAVGAAGAIGADGWVYDEATACAGTAGAVDAPYSDDAAGAVAADVWLACAAAWVAAWVAFIILYCCRTSRRRLDTMDISATLT